MRIGDGDGRRAKPSRRRDTAGHAYNCPCAMHSMPARRVLRADRAIDAARSSRSPPALAIVLALLAVLRSRRSSAAALPSDAGDTWAHLAQTVLPRYVGQHARARRAGRRGRGASAAPPPAGWSRAAAFPAAAFFAWALLLPLAMPAYVMAYAYTDFLQYAGPRADARCATLFGWSRRRLLVPGRALAARRRGDVRVRALSVRLPARAHRVPRAAARADRGGAHARPRSARARSGASSCRSRVPRSPAASRWR